LPSVAQSPGQQRPPNIGDLRIRCPRGWREGGHYERWKRQQLGTPGVGASKRSRTVREQKPGLFDERDRGQGKLRRGEGKVEIPSSGGENGRGDAESAGPFNFYPQKARAELRRVGKDAHSGRRFVKGRLPQNPDFIRVGDRQARAYKVLGEEGENGAAERSTRCLRAPVSGPSSGTCSSAGPSL